MDDEVSRDTSTHIRKKKQRGSEIHNLLIAQGKDPSEVVCIAFLLISLVIGSLFNYLDKFSM